MIWWIIGIIIVVILWLIFLYNKLITLKNRIKNAWAQIDVQLKRRYNLIPNLVNAVKGYMKHEKGVLKEVTEMRANLLKGGIKDKAKASSQITEALKTIFAVAENYPQLKASKNFIMLQEELAGTESKIAYARQFYNDTVMVFNTKIEKFPNNLISKTLGFNKEESFKSVGKERENVKVEF